MSPALSKIQEIQERGFAVVPGILKPIDVPTLRALLEECIQDDLERFGKHHPDAYMVQNLMMRGMPFARVMVYDGLHAYLSALLTDTCIIHAYNSSSMPPGGANSTHRIHMDCPRLIPGYITNIGVMMALDDFTVDNGATYFMPCSQNRADTPSEDEFMTRAERVFPRAGDAVFFNARTFHMGAPNTTKKPRHALTMNVCRSYMRQRFDYPRMVPQDVVDALGDVGRRFLGFNVRMPTSLEEYYAPEDKRRYKPNQG